MNATQLRKLGIPDACITQAIMTIQKVAKDRGTSGLKKGLKLVAENPSAFAGDATFGDLAKSILDERAFAPPEPIGYVHFCVVVDDLEQALEHLAEMGVKPEREFIGRAAQRIAFINDPEGNSIELMEIPPESAIYRA